MRHLKYTPKWMCVVLAGTLWFHPASASQEAPQPGSLEIVVVRGEGAINSLNQRMANEPVVEVRDENKRPLTGAVVVFTLPTQGASGEFGNSSKTLTVMTDDSGRATASGLKINQIPGKLQIHVNASYKGQTARNMITQFDMAVPSGKARSGSGKLLIVLVLVGAAAAGGIVAGTQKGGHSSAATPVPAANAPIGITVGSGTVGPP